jgi:hypothetical protein
MVNVAVGSETMHGADGRSRPSIYRDTVTNASISASRNRFGGEAPDLKVRASN